MYSPISLFDFAERRRFSAMRPRLYRLAYAWCHDSHLADDLAQDALAKALSRRGQLREEEALESWLFTILNNCWRDHLRARRDFADVEELDEVILSPDPGPDQNYASRQTTARVRDAIAALPMAQRQVITLVDIEECSYAEVAKVLDVPVGTVMSRLSRARRALKERLLANEAHCQPVLRRVK